jgi:hypothetical protein
MNLIESWWKQLKRLALKGRRCDTADEIHHAVGQALAYGNDHRRPDRWKKVPDGLPTPPLGGSGSILIPHAVETEHLPREPLSQFSVCCMTSCIYPDFSRSCLSSSRFMLERLLVGIESSIAL